ncbi:MAG TPA: cytochrome C oxidase subunit IV family protein [Myxococcota bacterium]|nr:cytochrome C oxidase subunit IV family protein [Myxococcota bacterium]
MSDHEAQSHAHPPVSLYVKVISTLTLITAFEILIIVPPVKAWYHEHLPAFAAIVVPVILILSAVKFWAVVYFFMHLRQDHGTPRMVFGFPLGLAALMIIVLMLLNGHFVSH